MALVAGAWNGVKYAMSKVAEVVSTSYQRMTNKLRNNSSQDDVYVDCTEEQGQNRQAEDRNQVATEVVRMEELSMQLNQDQTINNERNLSQWEISEIIKAQVNEKVESSLRK